MAARHDKTFRRISENKGLKYVKNVVQNVKNQIINGQCCAEDIPYLRMGIRRRRIGLII